jgi:hypothetical protein
MISCHKSAIGGAVAPLPVDAETGVPPVRACRDGKELSFRPQDEVLGNANETV